VTRPETMTDVHAFEGCTPTIKKANVIKASVSFFMAYQY
jgi:hypothetical protein